MDFKKLLEENLREAACFGDLKLLEELILNGVDVNSKNDMNGWTALHWAAHRNYGDAVSILLKNGADKSCLTNKGELPYNLTSSPDIQKLLGEKVSEGKKSALPITPNYLRNPPIHIQRAKNEVACCTANETEVTSKDELVLKIRLADSEDPNFIEIELPKCELTFEKLREVCCEELEINPGSVLRIQKLPNTTLRKDKDIQRLKDYQELEVVLREVVS